MPLCKNIFSSLIIHFFDFLRIDRQHVTFGETYALQYMSINYRKSISVFMYDCKLVVGNVLPLMQGLTQISAKLCRNSNGL